MWAGTLSRERLAYPEEASMGRELVGRSNSVASERGMVMIDEDWRTVLELPFEDTDND